MAIQGAYSVTAENSAESTRVRISTRVTKLREDFLSAIPYVCGELSPQVQMEIISITEHTS